jgi:hypothetical protein
MSDFCSLIGGAFMVGGLYSVLWGKSKEQKDNNKLPTTENGVSLNEKELAAAETPTNRDSDIVLGEKDMINRVQADQATDQRVVLEEIEGGRA